MQEVETKFQKYRFSIREKHIENYKKSIRFERSLETMRKGLRQGEKNADVNIQEQVGRINQLIQTNNYMKFIDLLSKQTHEFKLAVCERMEDIMDLVERKINTPEGICLLGNLASRNEEFIIQAYERQLIKSIGKSLLSFIQNEKHVDFYAWTLCQLTQKSDLVQPQQVKAIVPMVEKTLFRNKNNCNLLRLISYISLFTTLPQPIIEVLCSLNPAQPISIVSIFISISNQIQKLKKRQKENDLPLLIEHLCKWYDSIPNKVRKQEPSFYRLLYLIVDDGPNQIAQMVFKNSYVNIKNYVYGSKDYYELLCLLLQKIKLNESMIEDMKDLLAEITNDICDPNMQIGYHCCQIIKIILYELMTTQDCQILQYLKGQGLKENIEEFEQNCSQKKMVELGQLLIQMLEEANHRV